MEVCTKIIICHNIKGGVGKSTTAVNLSYNLSVMGYKVLGIDLDPQKNYTPFFRQADESKTIYQLMQDPRKVKSHILRSKYKDLDLIKGSSLLSDNFQNVDQLQKVLDLSLIHI